MYSQYTTESIFFFAASKKYQLYSASAYKVLSYIVFYFFKANIY